MTQSYSHTSKLQYGVITACQTARGTHLNSGQAQLTSFSLFSFFRKAAGGEDVVSLENLFFLFQLSAAEKNSQEA